MKCSLFAVFVFYSLVTISSTFGAGAASFSGVSPQKPIKDIKNKNPCITHRYSADPGVMVYNGRVYVYATNDGDGSLRNVGENTYSQINTINVMSSDDLVNWMDHGSIKAAGGSGAARWASNSWAPTATWKKINGQDKFFLYFANNASGIGVLTADSPTGPFKDPIGKALISRQTPNSNVEWLFDPAVFVDTDGTGYIYYGGGVPTGQNSNPKTIRAVKLGADMISISGTPVTIDAPWVFEDSGINKVGNTYLYSYCTNWANGPYGNAKIAYMSSSSPLGPFTYKGTCFDNPGTFFGTTGNNHHTIIEFKGKHYIFYHAEWLNKQIFGSQKGYRTTHVDEMPLNGSSFGNAKGTLTGPTQVKNVDGSTLNYAASFAWQSGISVSGQGAVTQVNYSRGGWTGVSSVSLGNASSITLKASSRSGATIKICTDSQNGQALGYVEIPAGGSLQNVTGNLSGASGNKNLFFISSGDATIESWQLGKGGNGGNSGNNNNNNQKTINSLTSIHIDNGFRSNNSSPAISASKLSPYHNAVKPLTTMTSNSTISNDNALTEKLNTLDNSTYSTTSSHKIHDTTNDYYNFLRYNDSYNSIFLSNTSKDNEKSEKENDTLLVDINKTEYNESLSEVDKTNDLSESSSPTPYYHHIANPMEKPPVIPNSPISYKSISSLNNTLEENASLINKLPMKGSNNSNESFTIFDKDLNVSGDDSFHSGSFIRNDSKLSFNSLTTPTFKPSILANNNSTSSLSLKSNIGHYRSPSTSSTNSSSRFTVTILRDNNEIHSPGYSSAKVASKGSSNLHNFTSISYDNQSSNDSVPNMASTLTSTSPSSKLNTSFVAIKKQDDIIKPMGSTTSTQSKNIGRFTVTRETIVPSNNS